MTLNIAWANRERTHIAVADAGGTRVVPFNPANPAVLSFVETGRMIEPWRPTAGDVRAECQRRIFALLGATSFEACTYKQLNMQMRATELTAVLAAGAAWTDDERAEADVLKQAATAIKALRVASNRMEAAPPLDFDADEHWSLPD